MNEIKELFQEVKDHELVMKNFKRLSLDIENLREKVRRLVCKRQEIIEKIKDCNVEEIETKLKALRSKIAELELNDMDIVTICHLEKLVNSSAQRSLVSQKVLFFIDRCIFLHVKSYPNNNLLQTKNITINKKEILASSGFLEILEKNNINFQILIIDKSVEVVLNMLVNTEMFYAVAENIRKKLNDFVQLLDIESLEIFECNDFLFFCSLHKDISSIQGRGLYSVFPVDFMSKYPRLFDIFHKLVRDKIAAIVQSGVFSYKVLQQIVDKFRDTPLSIGNTGSWALDVLVKELIRVSKHGDETIQMCDDLRDDVKCYSKAAGDIKRLYCKISENRSPRTPKAVEISIKGIQKYVNRLAQSKCLDDLLLAFNSAAFIGSEGTSTDLLKVCSDLKETIFHNVIGMFTIHPDLKCQNIQDAKLNIKRCAYEFFEATSKLLDTKRARFFRVTFFDASFNNFIQWILNHREISTENAYRFATVGEYMLSQCTFPPKEITNYQRMKCVNVILFNNPMEKYKKAFKQSLTIEEMAKLSAAMPWNVTLRSLVST